MASAPTKLLLIDHVPGINRVPSNYIRPEADRPNLTEVEASDASTIPLIDLQGLFGPNRDDIIRQIGEACQRDGFFQEVGEYCTRVRELALKLLEAISESLGLEREYISENLGKHGQQMAMNYYPPCPQPELTYGLPRHTDPNLITIPLQDDVPVFQVLRNGKWVAVNPIINTFIVNIGDQMQVISNNKYKSVLHRVVVNCDRERISIPTFYCPSREALIRPAHHEHPAVYRSFTYEECCDKFWKGGHRTDCRLDMFRIHSA